MWAWAETAGNGWRRGTRFLPGEESCKEASGRCGLDATTNNLRLLLERRQESFRAKENRRQSGKMSLLIFSGLTPVFAVRRAAQRASEAGCPEAVDCDLVSCCVSSFYGDKRRFSASLLTQKRSVSLPVQFLLADFTF